MLDRITIRDAGGLKYPRDIFAALGNSSSNPLLVIAPHDDDAQLAASVAIFESIRAGGEAHIVVVTDGRMGFQDSESKDGIIEARKRECVASCAAVGVSQKHLHRLEFPDATLHRYAGAWLDTAGSVSGLTADLTRVIRMINPGAVMIPIESDIHPDHRVVSIEGQIACFHSSSQIWPELGQPCSFSPALWGYACYAPFPGGPDLELVADIGAWERKRAAVLAYKSQPEIISSLLNDLENMGRREYFKKIDRPQLHYREYYDLFNK